METTRCALIFLLSACLWRESRTSSIKLCTDSPTSFVNGTAIPAMLGKPVSVVFCVQCDPRLWISPYIKIKLPSETTYPDYYYTNNWHEGSPVAVNITPSANKATINITIKTVQKEDFTNQFYVKINTNKTVVDNSVFFFRLSDAATSDTTTSDASLILSTQPEMPTATSIRTSPASSSTELSTVTSQASTAPTSTSSPTQEITQCWPHKTSLCPENWYQVDNETCILVTLVSNYELPKAVCKGNGSEPVKRQNFENLRSCVIKILGESKAASNKDVVHVDNMYVNVHSGTDVTGRKTYSVVCINRTFEKPTVSFKLEIYNETGWNLVDNSTDYVAVKTTYADVRVICRAEGVPTPRVIVKTEGAPKPLRENTPVASGNQTTYEALFRHAVCSQAGVYTCTANNSLGTTQAHRRIRILSPPKVKFTASNNKSRTEIRSGDVVDLRCSVDGCPDRVTITRNKHPIAETANYTIPFVHQIKGVTCSHMGTYTCLAKYPIGRQVQKTAILETKGCPVSLCDSEDASREMSPILGGYATFSLCLMSSEGLKFLANETKIVVNFTRNHIKSFYWTANITMYNIQFEDYRTHTVRIENSDGGLDVHFTLKDKDSAPTPVGQKALGHESLFIALPPVCFIILVFIIVGIVWYRVKGTRISRTRSEEVIDRGSGNDDSGEVLYANVSSVGRVPAGQEAEHQLQCQEYWNTADLHGKESGRFITADGLVYLTVANVNKQINKRTQGGKHPSKHKCDDEGRVEYITLDFEKTGKLLVADEEENKDDDSGEKTGKLLVADEEENKEDDSGEKTDKRQ